MGLALLKNFKSTAGLDQAMFQQMVQDMPVSVMVCDPQDFTITYANKSSIEALRGIESVRALEVWAAPLLLFMGLALFVWSWYSVSRSSVVARPASPASPP